MEMWGEDAVNQEESWSWGSGLLEDLQQSGSCHPPNSGLLPPDDELPVDVQQDEYTEDSMVTDLLLDSDTGVKTPVQEIQEATNILVNHQVMSQKDTSREDQFS